MKEQISPGKTKREMAKNREREREITRILWREKDQFECHKKQQQQEVQNSKSLRTTIEALVVPT